MIHAKTIFMLVLASMFSIFHQSDAIPAPAHPLNHEYIFGGNPALASIVQEISGDKFKIFSIANGSSLHTRRLTLNTATLLNKASIVFYASRESQPAIFNISKKMHNTRWVEICRDDIFIKKLISMGYYNKTNIPVVNGHIWTVPEVMSAAAEVIARNLSDKFKDDKVTFDQNLKKVQNSLSDLHEDAIKRLSLCNKVTVFSLHNGFFYINHAFGLKHDSIGSDIDMGLSPHSLQRYKTMNQSGNMAALFIDHSHIHAIHSMQDRSRQSITPIAIDTDGMLVNKANGLNGYIQYMKDSLQILEQNLCIDKR